MNKKIIQLFSVTLLFGCVLLSPDVMAAEKPLQVKLSMIGGYDNNTGLNSARKADAMAQESAAISYKRLLTRKAQMRLSYNTLNVNYFESTDQNILMNQVSGRISYLLSPATIWENDFTFQYLDFTRNVAVTSYSGECRTGIRQKLSRQLILNLGFSYLNRQYEDKKIRFGTGILSQDDERSDKRYLGDFQFNYKLNASVILNAGGSAAWNDSNDQFQDYYDYASYKLFSGFSWQINKKWLSSFKLIYENREYDSRLNLSSGASAQSDDTYTAAASLYYKINLNLSAGSSYTYRQKESNEPSQTYSGSLGTLGLYYSF